jgi:hypothetical protein
MKSPDQEKSDKPDIHTPEELLGHLNQTTKFNRTIFTETEFLHAILYATDDTIKALMQEPQDNQGGQLSSAEKFQYVGVEALARILHGGKVWLHLLETLAKQDAFAFLSSDTVHSSFATEADQDDHILSYVKEFREVRQLLFSTADLYSETQQKDAETILKAGWLTLLLIIKAAGDEPYKYLEDIQAKICNDIPEIEEILVRQDQSKPKLWLEAQEHLLKKHVTPLLYQHKLLTTVQAAEFESLPYSTIIDNLIGQIETLNPNDSDFIYQTKTVLRAIGIQTRTTMHRLEPDLQAQLAATYAINLLLLDIPLSSDVLSVIKEYGNFGFLRQSTSDIPRNLPVLTNYITRTNQLMSDFYNSVVNEQVSVNDSDTNLATKNLEMLLLSQLVRVNMTGISPEVAGLTYYLDSQKKVLEPLDQNRIDNEFDYIKAMRMVQEAVIANKILPLLREYGLPL